ncbi:MAG: hypothetical protein N2C12_11810 [Planctomycetales bacterium]
MSHLSSSLRLVVLLSAGLAVQPVWGVVPTQQLMPASTKGYVSIPDYYRLEASFQKTQIGQLLADPVMEPFSKDLERQLKQKWSKAHEPLGLTWDDIQGVPGGEVALARIQPAKGESAVAIIVDISGKQAEADALLATVAQKMTERRATKKTVEIAGIVLTIYTQTREKDKGNQAIFFVHPEHHQLVASDNLLVAQGILQRFSGDHNSLADVEAYQVAMERTRKEQGEDVEHLRWFVEPFGFFEAMRDANPLYKPKKGTDLLTVLRNQGFTAVQGAGGLITLADGQHDILHRTMIYAPPVKRAAGDLNRDKYDLAARLLNFPNSDVQSHQPPSWIPRNLAAFVSLNMDMQNAFEYSQTLVDELAGDAIFEDVLDSLKNDPKGPQVDVRKEVVANLGEHIMVLSSYELPINIDSERTLIAFELTDVDPVRAAVDKTMKDDKQAVKTQVGDNDVWEIVEAPIDPSEIKIDGLPEFEIDDEVDKNKKKMPTSAVTVAHGHLIISSHREFIEKVLKEADRRQTLSGSVYYQIVKAALARLGGTADAVQSFSRTDEEFRGTYELLKQGKMPESKTVMGHVLNAILDDDVDDEKLREQLLDGKKLPEYQMVRRYLGPAGMYVVSLADGWQVTGCFLSKENLQVVLKSD